MGLSMHCTGQSGTQEDADNVVDAGQMQGHYCKHC